MQYKFAISEMKNPIRSLRIAALTAIFIVGVLGVSSTVAIATCPSPSQSSTSLADSVYHRLSVLKCDVFFGVLDISTSGAWDADSIGGLDCASVSSSLPLPTQNHTPLSTTVLFSVQSRNFRSPRSGSRARQSTFAYYLACSWV